MRLYCERTVKHGENGIKNQRLGWLRAAVLFRLSTLPTALVGVLQGLNAGALVLQLRESGECFPALRAEIFFIQNALRCAVLISADDPHKVDHRLAPVTRVTGQLQPVTVCGSRKGGVSLRQGCAVLGQLANQGLTLGNDTGGAVIVGLDTVGGQDVGPEQIGSQPYFRFPAGVAVALE